MANKNVAGPIGKILTDALKEVCEHCNGVEFMFSMTFDDVNDVAGELAALGITAAGATICGIVFMCARCGHEQTRLAWILDVGASDGTAITMTHLDSTVANNLAGFYMIYIGADANDLEEVFVVNTNTAAAPTVITPVVAPHLDSDGFYIITQFKTEYTPAA